ncbi:MAG: hypothetical protein H7A41_04615 [Chlamydiales bacterium]|nr:hypothetical protein [Chlamydiales bacterium]
MSHIGNTFTYGAGSIATAMGLIGLWKVGQFLKSNGSVVSAGLLTGVATAAAVPLTKRAILYLPPEVYQDEHLQLLEALPLRVGQKDKIDFVLSSLASFALSLVVTAFLTNRLTYLISGYRLSYPKLAGVSLLSGVISGLGFGGVSLYMKQQSSRSRERKEIDPGYASYLLSQEPEQSSYFFSFLFGQLGRLTRDIDEADIAKTLEPHLTPEQFAQALSYFSNQPEWKHTPIHRDPVTLSPFKILAHVQDLEKRRAIFLQCPFISEAIKRTLGSQQSSEHFRPVEQFAALYRTLRNEVDTETLAMCIDFAGVHQEALLEAMERDMGTETITRDAVEAHLPPPVTSTNPRGMLDQLNGRIHIETAFTQLVEYLHGRGITDPKAYAKVLEQLRDENVIHYLNYMSTQERFQCFPLEDYSVTLSPFVVLAHFKDLDQRDRIFIKAMEMTPRLMETIAPQEATLEDYPAMNRIQSLNLVLQRSYNASVYAMIFDQVEDSRLQGALLGVFDNGSQFYDFRGQPITRRAIEALMRKSLIPPIEIPPFTQQEGIATALSGVGTLAVTSAVLSAMILTSRLAHWTWDSYPTLRGVFPAAAMTGVGYMVGTTATSDKRVGYLVAFVLSTFASPKVSKLISTHQMSYWHGAGFSAAGIYCYLAINNKQSSRRLGRL